MFQVASRSVDGTRGQNVQLWLIVQMSFQNENLHGHGQHLKSFFQSQGVFISVIGNTVCKYEFWTSHNRHKDE